MAHQPPTESNQKELKYAQNTWHNFTKIIKYAAYAACLTASLLALGFYAFVRT